MKKGPEFIFEHDEPETIGQLIDELGEACEEAEEIEPDWKDAHREQLADLALVIDDCNARNGWGR